MKNILLIKEYDSHGKLIYGRYPNGFEEWLEYDFNGNVIHFKYSNGYEKWYEYDQNGNEIHSKDSNGREKWYNLNGRQITRKKYEKLHGIQS